MESNRRKSETIYKWRHVKLSDGNLTREKEELKTLHMQLKTVIWLEKNFTDDKLKNPNKNNQVPIIIYDDVPDPSDFELSVEEYKRIYEEKLKNKETVSENQKEYTDGFTKSKGNNILSVVWLNASLDSNSQQDIEDQPVIEEVRPAATFELTPEEYKRIKEELEEERRMTQGLQ